MARVTPLAAVVEAMDREWRWGVCDCCTAACDAFAALHGIDPMAPLRGRYDTALGAARIIRAHGGPLAMAEHLAGLAGLRPGIGLRGEVGVVSGEGLRMALALCLGPQSWAAKTARGFATVHHVERFWRV